MSVFLMTFLKLLIVCADLSSRLILDQRSGPKCLRECLLYFIVLLLPRIPIIPLPRGQHLIAFAMVVVVEGRGGFCHQRSPRGGTIVIVEFNVTLNTDCLPQVTMLWIYWQESWLVEIFIIEGDGNQPERSKQGHILRVLRQVKDVFSRMKYTYIL